MVKKPMVKPPLWSNHLWSNLRYGQTTYGQTAYGQTSAMVKPPMVKPPMVKPPMVKPPRTMLVDDRKEIRELAAKRIKLARQSNSADSIEVRKFKVPSVNLDANDYHCLVNWQELPRTQPPMLNDISDDEIDSAIEIPHKWYIR